MPGDGWPAMIDFDEAIEAVAKPRGPRTHLQIFLEYVEANHPDQYAKIVAALRSRREQTSLAEALTHQARSVEGLLPEPKSRISPATIKSWREANEVLT